MNIHLTWWWLWLALIIIYALGVIIPMLITMIADENPPWWMRPAILIWPITAAVLMVWHTGRFLIGRE